VFDLPCPSSFVGVNRVVGNLVIEQDPVFGGGELRVSGKAEDGKRFALNVEGDRTELLSARSVEISSADNNIVAEEGHAVTIRAGAGVNTAGGSGGDVIVQAGAGHGTERDGGTGAGGAIELTGGSALGDGRGGEVSIVGGASTNSTGGHVEIMSGYSEATTSGDVIIQTGDGGKVGASGKV
jgi:hypothetical protein